MAESQVDNLMWLLACALGRLPETGERFYWRVWKLDIIEPDGPDSLLATPRPLESPEPIAGSGGMTYQIPTASEPVSAEYLRALDEIDRLACWLDFQFRLPLTRIRFGWDAVIGLVPIVGDLIALALALRIIASARRLGASPTLLRRMTVNAGIDALAGAIPIAGTVFDVFFRANLRNVALLMDAIRQQRTTRA